MSGHYDKNGKRLLSTELMSEEEQARFQFAKSIWQELSNELFEKLDSETRSMIIDVADLARQAESDDWFEAVGKGA